MVGTTGGFRVLGNGGARHGGHPGAEPRIVVYRLDPATLAFAEVSGRAEALLGFPPGEWCRPGFLLDRLHPDDRQAARAFLRAWTRDRRSHELQFRLIDAGGRVRRVHDLIEVRDGGAAGQEIRGVLIDITGRAARGPEVRTALRLRDELLRIVAEELARPVRAISDHGDMLGRHLSAQRDDVGSDHAIGIRDGVQRLDALIAKLMRVAQGGDMTLDEMTERLGEIHAAGRNDDRG